MDFAGLTLAQVLGLLGAAGSVVVVLYLLKLRRRRVPVPFAGLWESVLRERQATRLFSRLKRWLSLLVALIIVALLAFALGDPRPPGASHPDRTRILLVDASASMQATDVAPSRLAAALERARSMVRSMGPGERMLIARLAEGATPLTPMTDDASVLLDAIDHIEPEDVGASLSRAIPVVLDLLRGAPEPELVLLTDGALEAEGDLGDTLAREGIRLGWVRFGEKSENVAIHAFAVRRYPLDKSQAEVLLELRAYGDQARDVELTLLGDGRPIDVQRLTVEPDAPLRRFFSEISGADATLEARIRPLEGADPLAVDDRAFARLPDRRRARVLVVGPENLYLDAALLLDEYLEVTTIRPGDYRSAEGYDVAIFDGWVPPSSPDVAAIYFHPSAQEGAFAPLRVTGEIERPFFDRLDRDHPLLRFVALRDVNIGSALRFELERGDVAIGADSRGPLVVEGTRDGSPFLAIAFDPRVSDLPLRVAWPVLLLGAIDRFVQAEHGDISAYSTGETWSLAVPESAESVDIVEPSGERHRVPVTGGRAVFRGAHVGFHRLVAGGETTLLAANLGVPEESAIAPGERLRVGAVTASAPRSSAPGLPVEPWAMLVLVAVAILSIEWATYHRRLTT